MSGFTPYVIIYTPYMVLDNSTQHIFQPLISLSHVIHLSEQSTSLRLNLLNWGLYILNLESGRIYKAEALGNKYACGSRHKHLHANRT